MNDFKELLTNPNPSNIMWDKFMYPMLFLGSTYLPVSKDIYLTSKRHTIAARLPHLDSNVAQQQATFFANMLETEHGDVGTYNTVAVKPSNRVAAGPFVVFTFEYDTADKSTDMESLTEQLDWVYTLDKCDIIYDVFLSDDSFYGMTVNYSGSKGLHFHILVDPNKNNSMLFTLKNLTIRNAYMHMWSHTLLPIMQRVLRPTHAQCDMSLEQPDKWRRSPNSLRTIEDSKSKKKHVFAEVGDQVMQTTLWEKYNNTNLNLWGT